MTSCFRELSKPLHEQAKHTNIVVEVESRLEESESEVADLGRNMWRRPLAVAVSEPEWQRGPA